MYLPEGRISANCSRNSGVVNYTFGNSYDEQIAVAMLRDGSSAMASCVLQA
jgi:hypothetical protein